MAVIYHITKKLLFSVLITIVLSLYAGVFVRSVLIKKYSELLVLAKDKYCTKKKSEILSDLTSDRRSSLIETLVSSSLPGDKVCSNGVTYFGGIPLIQMLSFGDDAFSTDELDRFIELGYSKLAIVCNSNKKDEILKKYDYKIVLCITENELFGLLGNVEILPPLPEKPDIKAVLNRNTAKSWLRLGGVLIVCSVISGKLSLFGGMGLVFIMLSVATNVYCLVKARQ